MKGSMHPLLLTFSDPSLEQEYENYAFRSTYKALDKLYLKFCIFLQSFFILRTVSEGGNDPFSEPLAPALMVITGHLILCGTRRVLGEERSKALRMPIISIWRIWTGFWIALSQLASPWVYEISNRWDRGLAEIIVVSGCGVGFLSALGARLKFKHHLVVQVLTIVIASQGKFICACALASPGGSHLLTLAGWVHLLTEFVQSAFLGVYPFAIRSGFMDQCGHVLSLANIFLGFGVVSYVVWRMERFSRVCFIKSMEGSGRDLPEIEAVTEDGWMSHYFYFPVAFAACSNILAIFPWFVSIWAWHDPTCVRDEGSPLFAS